VTDKTKSLLFFNRRKGEKVIVGEGRNEVSVEVARITDDNVRLIFNGPRHVAIDRAERRNNPDK